MKKSEILVEFHNWKPIYVLFSLILLVLTKKYNSSCVGFRTFNEDLCEKSFLLRLKENIKFYLGNFLKIKTFKSYKLFGVPKILKPNVSKANNEKAKKFFNNFYKKKKITNNDICNLKVDNIYIGDILYDSVLKSENLSTIDVYSSLFKNKFIKFLSLFFFWKDYFNSKNVKAVITCHGTYLSAIPLRIASTSGIKAIVAGVETIWQLNKKIFHTHKENISYDKIFKKFDKSSKQKFINEAKYKYRDVFFNLKKTIKKQNVLKPNKKLKVLISPHSFSDSPHVRGKNLFPDFYLWLIYLLDKSKSTNYEWYIKFHPNYKLFFDDTYFTVKNIIKNQYKNINWVDPKIKNKDLVINKNIDVGLTVHGSIGHELPLYNIPVINASINNPHKNYDFNFHPKDMKQYKKVIDNLHNIKININKDKVFEYIFMHHMYFDKTWLGKEFNKILIKDDYDQFTKIMESNIILDTINFDEVNNLLTKFFNTNNYCLLINKSNIIKLN